MGSVGTGMAMQLIVAVSGILAARLLGVDDRGRLALLWIVSLASGQMATLGVPSAVAYVVARGADARAVLWRLRSILIAQCAGGALLAATILALVLDDRSGDSLLAAAAVVVIPPVLVLWLTALAVAQGQQRYAVLQRHRVLQALLYVLALAALTVAGEDDLPVVVVAWVATMLIAAAYAWRDCVGTWRIRGPQQTPPQEATPSQLIRFGTRGFLGAFGATEHLMLDQLLIGIALASRDLGLFVAAAAFAGLPRFLGQSVGSVAYPEVARRSTIRAKWAGIVRYVSFAILVLVPVVAVLIATVGELLPFLFGSEFAGAVPVARLLLIAGLLQALRRVASEASRGLGSGVPGALAEGVGVAALVGVAIPLALTDGADGAALGVLIASAAATATLALLLGAARYRSRGRIFVAEESG